MSIQPPIIVWSKRNQPTIANEALWICNVGPLLAFDERRWRTRLTSTEYGCREPNPPCGHCRISFGSARISTGYRGQIPRSECFVQTQRWWTLYRDAVLETDPAKIEERIREPEEAIGARSSLTGQMPASEQSALEDAHNRKIPFAENPLDLKASRLAGMRSTRLLIFADKRQGNRVDRCRRNSVGAIRRRLDDGNGFCGLRHIHRWALTCGWNVAPHRH
jgi:hypothetical protein